MSIEIKIGQRGYEFELNEEARMAKDIYNSTFNSNGQLEDYLDSLCIEWTYAWDGF